MTPTNNTLISALVTNLFFICGCAAGESSPDSYSGTDTETESPVATELSWRLHDEYQSLVYVSWNQSSNGPVHVEYKIDDDWFFSPSLEASEGVQEQLIVGIPYATDSQWRVVQEGGQSEDGPTITTGAIPVSLPLGSVTVSSQSDWYPQGNYLLTSINQASGGWVSGVFWTFIIDRKARPVWARKAPLNHWTLYSQVAASGEYILWDENTYWGGTDSGVDSKVHFTYLDAEFDVVATPGLHHPFVQLPDGTLAWGSMSYDGSEYLVEKKPGASDETVIWSTPAQMSNCLFYVEETNTYLYSFFTDSSVVEIDRADGASLWWAGDLYGGYTFIPPDSQFSWQHGVSYTETGTLLLSTQSGQTTCVHEYTVDHENNVLELVWRYDSGIHAETNGDAWRLDNGNTLHLVGSAGHIVEVDEEGAVVWRVEFNDKLLGRGQFIEDLYGLISPQ